MNSSWEVKNPAGADYVSVLTILIPPLTWLVYGENRPPPLSFLEGMLAYLN